MKSLNRVDFIFLSILFFLFFFESQRIYAQAGMLDPSFGVGGKVSVDFSNDRDEAFVVKAQNDRKLVVAGLSMQSGNNDFALTRLNADGSLDQSFGDNGKIVQTLGPYSDYITDIGFQSDGKIIAMGNSYSINAASEVKSVIAVCRYNVDGTIDNTFGNDGKVTIDLPGAYDIANAGDIQGDNKIIVVGYTGLIGSRDFFIIRLNPDGSMDNSFGSGGQKIVDFGDSDDEAKSVIISNDGKIYAAGYSLDNNTLRSEMAVVCLNPDGSFHSDFSTGKVNVLLGGIGSEATSIALTSSNEVIVSGYNATATADNFALVKLSKTGELVWSFGDIGRVFTNLGSNSSQSRSMTIQQDDKIVVSGYNVPNGSIRADFATVRYNSDGSIDEEFGDNGIVLTDFTGFDEIVESCIVQSDDKIVLGGSFTLFNNPRDFSIVRYLTNEKLRISNDTVICSGYVDDIVLKAFDGLNSYHWIDSLHPSVELGSEKTLTVKPLETTTYGVISGIDTAYCKVTVDDPVVAKFSINEKEGKVIFKPTIVNESIGGDYYSWDFGNSTKVDVSHAEDLAVQRTYYPIYGYAGEFNIRLGVTRSSGCKDSAFTQVMVSYKPQVNPTAFSPNDDGLNDTFNYKISNAIRIEGNIYNRWGEKIYSMNTNGNVFSWDGSQNSLHSPMGCYIYALKSTDIRGETKTISGRVLLVR